MVNILKEASNCLQEGGILLYPTDTIWGVGCDAFQEKAIEQVYKLKGRSSEKSLIVLLDEARNLFKYVSNLHPDIIHILSQLERPTTVIYENVIGFPDILLANDGSIGIRVVRDEFCKRLIKKLGRPIVSTSANISGEPSPGNFSEISESIKLAVDYIVDYRREETGRGISSQIVRIKEDGQLEIVRA